jgi:hypothetical protein
LYINAKIIPVKTVPGIGRGRINENGGGRWIQVW